MPNGKPGDHPLNDIVVHRERVFGAPIDERVIDIWHAAKDERARAVLGDSFLDSRRPPEGAPRNPARPRAYA